MRGADERELPVQVFTRNVWADRYIDNVFLSSSSDKKKEEKKVKEEKEVKKEVVDEGFISPTAPASSSQEDVKVKTVGLTIASFLRGKMNVFDAYCSP